MASVKFLGWCAQLDSNQRPSVLQDMTFWHAPIRLMAISTILKAAPPINSLNYDSVHW
jgi:hypothetical protein